MRQGLCNSTVSVRLSDRLSVCLSHPVRRVCCCGSRGKAMSIDCCSRQRNTAARRSAANAGSVTLSADAGSWGLTCFIQKDRVNLSTVYRNWMTVCVRAMRIHCTSISVADTVTDDRSYPQVFASVSSPDHHPRADTKETLLASFGQQTGTPRDALAPYPWSCHADLVIFITVYNLWL